MDKRVAEVVLRKCLGFTDGETLLVVTDTPMERLAAGFYRAACSLGIEASIISMSPRADHTQEPPPAVAEALRHCSAAVLLTSTSLTHTRARQVASDRHRVRIASMPGVDPHRLEHLLLIDYDDLAARCDELARHLDGPHHVRISSAAGTNLEFSIGNRTVYRDCGNLRAPGAFGVFPCGEVCLAPLEGTAKGVVIIDGSVGGLGLPDAPVRIRFEAGRAVDVSDKAFDRLLRRHGELAFNLAELGIGMNPHAQIVGNVVEDEKAGGTAHIALGSNTAMGGVVNVPVHVDTIMLDARIEVDGVSLDDKWFTPARRVQVAARPAPARGDEHASGTYRALFEHSNDAQYVLDLGTQRLLEVNPSFERLTGYDREDLLEGSLTAQALVARESETTFRQKLEGRSKAPTDRYDIKLLCKDGQKKPVELTVRRMLFDGREVMIGSAKDLTAHKRLEQEMWEKIQELGFASNRILALTEKMRRVPEFTPRLLSATDEPTLLEKATEMLCSREGLNCAEATFHVLRGDTLELAFSNTSKTRKRRVKLSSDARIVRILKGEEPPEITKFDAVLPLKGRERPIGVLELTFHPKDIEVLEGNDRALKGYHDLLETMSSIIGLLVDNLHLYDTVRLQSIVDPLTGSYNRRFFDQKVADEIQRAARYERDLSLLLIDVDHFKAINDTTSYKQGDLVLVETARLFKSLTREVDFVCRIGGDEFAVIMPETGYDAALQKAEQLRKHVADRVYENLLDPSQPVRVTLSIGVTAYTADVRTMDDMLTTVDAAIHAAKRAGRDTVCGQLPPSADARQEKAAGKWTEPA